VATRTLDRQVEVIATKETPEEAVLDAAKTEDRARVDGSGLPQESRAWNAQAQID
jgi:hypothetical protein